MRAGAIRSTGRLLISPDTPPGREVNAFLASIHHLIGIIMGLITTLHDFSDFFWEIFPLGRQG